MSMEHTQLMGSRYVRLRVLKLTFLFRRLNMKIAHRLMACLVLTCNAVPAEARRTYCFNAVTKEPVPCPRPAEESAEDRLKREPWRKLPVWDKFQDAYLTYLRSTTANTPQEKRDELKPFVLAHRDEIREVVLSILSSCLNDAASSRLCAKSGSYDVIPFAQMFCGPRMRHFW